MFFFLLYLTIFFFVLHELTYLLYPKLLMLVNCLHCTAVSEMLTTATDDSTINFFSFPDLQCEILIGTS